ncbi:tail fiber assembly protein [Xenorhabdus sp. PB30.3]|uniref:tail fiber assembly protein n=1 Tax=Xenorhabdus sp. PB30.3 TaxID=2788941 RepID=UPI001E57FD7E|nr:tail fiber assembly protein [Xenorhabdus sp. PB30.3]MCC8379571.1 tail fiber assembly protein [Xenorhabdus sp. PB30.3]
MYTYSAKTNAFYLNGLKQRYIECETWPDDGIDVSEAVFNKFAGNMPPMGKMRIAGADGLPAWGDIPPPTPEARQRWAEQDKQRLMAQASKAIAPLQDAVDLGMATPIEKTTLMAWRKYRVLLNRVDCSAAPDIHWPTQPK